MDQFAVGYFAGQLVLMAALALASRMRPDEIERIIKAVTRRK